MCDEDFDDCDDSVWREDFICAECGGEFDYELTFFDGDEADAREGLCGPFCDGCVDIKNTFLA